MTEMNPNQITGTISITVLPQDNGQYVCQISSSLGDRGDRSSDCTHFYGQTKEHAIANALEQLADDYRKFAEDSQDIDSLAVEVSDSGTPIEKHYHVILHYERIAEAESKFEAIHDTILGNTVVENAKISAIEISPDLQINPLTRSWT
jgi:phosphoribosylformylglycinamidine (FGAM) synthase PurS component